MIHKGIALAWRSSEELCFDVLRYYGNTIAGFHVHVMAPMILVKLPIIACGIVVLLATVSAAKEEKRSTEQLKHAPLEHAHLISNNTTLAATVAGAHTRTHARTCTMYAHPVLD